ncbi:MAG: HPr(Ser) kinase/phosphatase, partial [Chromatiales bacterium]
MTDSSTTRDLFEALRDQLSLEWIAGRSGEQRSLRGDFPGAAAQALVGPLNCIHPNRIQVIGRCEQVYLSGLRGRSFEDFMDKLFCGEPAALIVADGIQPDPLIIEYADRTSTPLLAALLPDNELVSQLQYFLTHLLADSTILHGVFLEVLGMGVLLTGDAAVGKSELALELISRGHRLIADDAPRFSRITPDIIEGTCPEVLREFLEVRGLGVLNIRAMFGDAAIKEKKYLRLIVHLSRMGERELARMDRLGAVSATRTILGLEVPEVLVPVASGRNMAIL